jgi:hypothetical protein
VTSSLPAVKVVSGQYLAGIYSLYREKVLQQPMMIDQLEYLNEA